MSLLSSHPLKARERVGELLATLRNWPWFDTVRTLRQRFREDRLGLTAGSLTFATLIALVPLATVMLAVFAAFPMFSAFQGAVETYFLQSLVPQNIARPVLEALTQFAGKASRMGAVGLILLLATALAMMLTIDRSLNAIWRVRKPRAIAQRILVYWAALTLGPLALGVSLSVTSYALSSSRGLVSALPGAVAALLGALEFVVLAAVVAGLFRFVPNTRVQWRHAWAGALFVALAFELAKRGLAWYVVVVPSYSAVYGAFAALPIFMLWIFLGWVIVLLGAVIAAYAPSLQMRIVLRPATPGQSFNLALALLKGLAAARDTPQRGLTLAALAAELRTDPLHIEALVETLIELDWVARLDEGDAGRLVLLCDPPDTLAQPLLTRLLLAPSDQTAAFRHAAGLDRLTLAEVLGD